MEKGPGICFGFTASGRKESKVYLTGRLAQVSRIANNVDMESFI